MSEFNITVDDLSAKCQDIIPYSIKNADKEASICHVNETVICHKGNKIQDRVTDFDSPIVRDALDLEEPTLPNGNSTHSHHEYYASIIDDGVANAHYQLNTPEPDVNTPF